MDVKTNKIKLIAEMQSAHSCFAVKRMLTLLLRD